MKTLVSNKQKLKYTGSIAVLREYLFIFVPFATLLLIAVSIHYISVFRSEKLTIETRELLNVGLARSALNNDLATALSDLKFLTNYISTQGFDAQGQLNELQIMALLLEFSQQKKLYDQIRFISRDGMERIRVNFDGVNARVVEKFALQNKSDRYYFQDAVKLEPDEVYISRFDLNVEEGEIEYPIKPVIRLAMPAFSDGTAKKGILVINYLGDRLLDSFVRTTANISDHIHLINSDGYWLHAPINDHAWGFMLPHSRRFSDQYQPEWAEITTRRAGQIRTGQGLFSFETVTPIAVAAQSLQMAGVGVVEAVDKTQRWYVVAQVVPEQDVPRFSSFLLQHLPVYLLMIILIAVGSWLLAMTRLNHRRAEIINEYETRFRNTLENMTLLAVGMNTDAKIHFCNNPFLELTGWRREEVLERSWVDSFVIPELRKEIKQVFSDLQNKKTFPPEVETELITRKGVRRLVSWHNTLIFDGNGKVTGITAIGEDISDKRRNELQVRRLSRVVEESPSIIVLTDDKGLIEYVNPKFTEVTGYAAEEVMGMNPRILKSGETSKEDYRSLWDTLSRGEVWHGEFHNKRKNGELYWEAGVIFALRDEQGKITNYIAIKEDVSEQKRLQVEVERHQKEIARNQVFTEMGRMAGEIAHDLRNPLSSVKMTLQILGKQVSAEQQELKEIGLGQVNYIENILSDMLAYARPDTIRSEWVDVGRLLERILRNHLDECESLAICQHFELQSDLPPVAGDPDKLQRLFNNLISNAIQAMNDETVVSRNLAIHVTLDKDERDSRIEILVCDTGVGLDDVDAESLFEPFYTTHTQGTGLGLAIVRQIVEQHHGSIDLAQGEDGRTCATVLLPVSEL